MFLEYDDDRSGGFEPLAEIPDDKVVVLGLVSTKTDTVETRDEIERRIDETARFHPSDRLAISPQRGFASAMRGNPLSEAKRRAKLELGRDIPVIPAGRRRTHLAVNVTQAPEQLRRALFEATRLTVPAKVWDRFTDATSSTRPRHQPTQ